MTFDVGMGGFLQGRACHANERAMAEVA